jgi:hypothetical protein
MKLLEFIFSGFWIWLGFTIIFGAILNFILSFYNRTLRHWNIRKHGYPPAHCDADGDFLNGTE